MADSTMYPPVVAATVDSSSDLAPSSPPEESPQRSPSEVGPSAARRAADKAAGAGARPTPKPHRPAKGAPTKVGAQDTQPVGKAPHTAQSARSGGSHSTRAPHSPTGSGDRSTPQRSAFSQTELGSFRDALLAERERLLEEVAGLREDSLLRHDEVNHEEDGTDAFIRLSGLDRAGQEQARVIQIDEALRTLDEGHYGICEACGCCIETARLELLPFVKNCIRCQSEAEGGTRARISARARLWQ